jgi:hypothetical protein
MVDRQPEGVGGSDVGTGTEVPIRFEGDRTGVGELSWGQRDLWRVMEEKHTWLPIGTALPLPPGTTVTDATEDLRFVMSHYPSLRTRLRFDPDGPRQVVSAGGEIRLEIVDAPDDADPAEVAEQVRRRLWRADHDFVSDWPMKMAVIRHRGQLTHRVWVMCHLAADGSAARIILSELANRDSSGSRAALSALDQARWQRSPAGQRQSEAVLRHWERILLGIPATRFPDRTGSHRPRYWQGRSDSPALHQAVQAISARTGVEERSVLLAIFAVALARITGITPVVARVVVGNRFRPGLAQTVSPIMQGGLCPVDPPDGTVDEAVTHTRRRAFTAYKYAYCDPDQRDALIERVNQQRGERVDLSCFFNDRRLKPRDQTGPPPTPEQLRAAVPRGSFQWDYKQDEVVFDTLFINVDDQPDTCAMTICTDIQFLSPEDVEACVRGMEEVAVAAALDSATRTGVPASGARR